MDVSLSADYFLTVIVPAIIVVVGSIIIERGISSKISGFGKDKKLPPSHVHAVKLIFRWIIGVVDILLLTTIFGLAIGRIWMVVSTIAAMIIIGFVAVWSILGNILAALILMIWRPFQIGDKISILPENITGEALETNLFFTKIKTEEGNVVSVPNTQVMQKFIKVFHEEPQRGEE